MNQPQSVVAPQEGKNTCTSNVTVLELSFHNPGSQGTGARAALKSVQVNACAWHVYRVKCTFRIHALHSIR